jgi:hypothetical protein
MKFKPIIFAFFAAISLSACVDNEDKMLADQDSAVIDDEVKTPQQNTYSSNDQCAKDFPDAGDCVEKIVIVNGQSQSNWIGPYFFLWGALLHNNGMYSYGYSIPRPMAGVTRNRVILLNTMPRPNYSAASTYIATRKATLTTSRTASSNIPTKSAPSSTPSKSSPSKTSSSSSSRSSSSKRH